MEAGGPSCYDRLSCSAPTARGDPSTPPRPRALHRPCPPRPDPRRRRAAGARAADRTREVAARRAGRRRGLLDGDAVGAGGQRALGPRRPEAGVGRQQAGRGGTIHHPGVPAEAPTGPGPEHRQHPRCGSCGRRWSPMGHRPGVVTHRRDEDRWPDAVPAARATMVTSRGVRAGLAGGLHAHEGGAARGRRTDSLPRGLITHTVHDLADRVVRVPRGWATQSRVLG